MRPSATESRAAPKLRAGTSPPLAPSAIRLPIVNVAFRHVAVSSRTMRMIMIVMVWMLMAVIVNVAGKPPGTLIKKYGTDPNDREPGNCSQHGVNLLGKHVLREK